MRDVTWSVSKRPPMPHNALHRIRMEERTHDLNLIDVLVFGHEFSLQTLVSFRR